MESKEIDESLYSRQLYVIGKDAMQKMMSSRILVIGLDGLGQEVVKNLCLMGVSHISIYDKETIKEEDLSIGFYFKKASVGQVKDSSLLHKFRSLNEYVQVHIVENLESFSGYDLVIVCNEHVSKQIEFNRQARRDSCKYISCQVRGLFSQIFCDFGTDFVCLDQNGEVPVTGMINDITADGLLTVVDEQRHNLEDGDVVRILHKEEYEGVLFQVKSVNQSSVQLSKIDGISVMDIENGTSKAYVFTEVYGGDFEQVKKPKMLHFRSLEEAVEDPKIVVYGDKSRETVIHKCFVSLSDYIKSFGVFPNENNLLSYFVKKHENLFEYEPLIREFGRQCGTTLMPMCSVVGGFVAQEALKAISSKFNPISQFLYFDALDAVPENIENYDTNPEGYGRYASLVKIFGRENVSKLFGLKVFLVGSGAIGCEHLKNLVMCGMGRDGEIHVTDMDSIEQSNLTRQFLFSKGDVSKMKAEVAVREVRELNEDFSSGDKASSESTTSGNLHYYNLKVGEETEEVFSDDFFRRMDIVANALDNVEARLYIDGRCLLSRKFLVDAGTSGTKGNVQVVVPFYTEPYGASRDPPEKSIPLCTIKNFPHAIEHTIEWAMSEFRFRFHDQIISIREYLEYPSQVEEESSEGEDDVTKRIMKKETIQETVRNAPSSVEGCIKSALMLFVRYFHTSIKDLLTTFPQTLRRRKANPSGCPLREHPHQSTST